MTDRPSPTTSPDSRRPPPWALIVGLGQLVVIAGLFLVILVNRQGDGAAVSSPTAPLTSSAMPTQTSAPTATAQPPSPSPAEPPALPEDYLPPGAVITITADGVRLRAGPSTAAEILGVMSAGDPAYVVDSIAAGPVVADGHDWYLVEYAGGKEIWPWQDVSSSLELQGWMAAGDSHTRFAKVADVTCPSAPVTLELLAFGVTPWERLACFGGQPITLQGTYGCDSCLEPLGGAEPAWLADSEHQAPLAGSYQNYPYALIAVPPEVAAPQNRDIVSATLHLDDPVSASCTYTPPDGAPNAVDPLTPKLFCRERLVLDSFEVSGRDDSPS